MMSWRLRHLRADFTGTSGVPVDEFESSQDEKTVLVESSLQDGVRTCSHVIVHTMPSADSISFNRHFDDCLIPEPQDLSSVPAQTAFRSRHWRVENRQSDTFCRDLNTHSVEFAEHIGFRQKAKKSGFYPSCCYFFGPLSPCREKPTKFVLDQQDDRFRTLQAFHETLRSTIDRR